mgnify:CR=1 FL=1
MVESPTIEDLTTRVDGDLRNILGSRHMDLYRMMSYHLGWEDELGNARISMSGQRSHGVACLVACHAAAGDMDVALPAASSVELINGFSQIHDDVQGGQPKRDGRDAMWWIWGPAQGINTGDGMHALARLSIFRLQEFDISPATTFRAIQLIDEASLALCEGRFQDLEAQERIDLDVDAYLSMASSKTGALYSCAMKLGALVASADGTIIDSMSVCGANIGTAMQVRDDLTALWGNGQQPGSPNPEVLNKKKLLPVVYALEKANIHEKRRLGEIYFKRVLETDDVESVRQVLEELGAREYCEELIRGYCDAAVDAVAGAGVLSEGKAAVSGLVDSLLGS